MKSWFLKFVIIPLFILALLEYVPRVLAGGGFTTGAVASFNTRTGIVSLILSDIVNAGGAPIASPTFTGTPQAPTPAANDSSTNIDTTQFVQTAYPMGANGRLTLTSGTPVLSGDVSAATTIYFTPYLGYRLSLYNGTNWVNRTFSEVSLALSATSHLSGSVYDLFVWNNAGTLQLVSGPAWTNATTRSAAISLLNGLYVNTASMAGIASGSTSVTVPAQQGLYVGTFYANAAGQTAMIRNPASASGGSHPVMLLWSYFNRVKLTARNVDNGVSYTYNGGIRQARASANNQIDFCIGIAEETISVLVGGSIQPPATAATYGRFGTANGAASITTGSGFKVTNPATAAGHTITLYTSYVAPNYIGGFGSWFLNEDTGSGGSATFGGDAAVLEVSYNG